MGLTRRVADLRGRFFRSSDWKRFRDGITAPLGLGGLVVLVLGVFCRIAMPDIDLGEAPVGVLLELLGFVLLVLSMAREAGVSLLGLAVLSFGAVGGVGVAVVRPPSAETSSAGAAVFILVFHLLCSNARGLSKEEFNRRYNSPPGLLSYSKLKSHPRSDHPERSPAPESDV